MRQDHNYFRNKNFTSLGTALSPKAKGVLVISI
jgi:hypothetical protein